MPLNRSSIKYNHEATKCFRDILTCSHSYDPALTAGMPSARIVTLSSTGSHVTFPGRAGAVNLGTGTTAYGVVKDGYEPEANISYMPTSSDTKGRVTVVNLGIYMVEVVAGAVIPVGQELSSDIDGRATAAPGGTGLFAMTAATGVGTASNPEFVVVLIRGK